jgi:hypothetical protein
MELFNKMNLIRNSINNKILNKNLESSNNIKALIVWGVNLNSNVGKPSFPSELIISLNYLMVYTV